MRVLIAYRYFLPDTPAYAAILGNISFWLAEAGHDVEVITAQPAYKPNANIPKQVWRETMNGVDVRRVRLFKEKGMGLAKAVNYALFILRSFLIVLFGPRRDVIMAGTTPPVLQGWFLSLAAKVRGSEFIYHMQDIHPEIVSFNDGKMVKGASFNLFRCMDSATNKRATANIVIGNDMRDVLIERGANPVDVKVIRNFAVNSERTNSLTHRSKDKPVRFVFAGNIGVFQNLENLVLVFGQLDPTKVTLVLVGEGRAKKNLIQLVKNQDIKNVEFHAHMSEGDVFNFLCDQDVGLVSLLPGLYKYAFPSKIWTYIAADLPMLSIVEDESGIAKFLKSNNFGESVNWQSSQEDMVKTILAMVVKVKSGEYSMTTRKQLYHSSAAQRHWVDLFDSIRLKREKKS